MDVIFIATILVLGYMTAIFLLALALEDNSIVDIFYGTAFLVGCWGAYLYSDSHHPRQWLLLGMVSVWGIRLAVHLFFRKKGKGEDFRYRKWREEWGKTFVWRSFLQIFLLQGLIVVLVAKPVLLVIANPDGPLGWLDLAGVAVWLFGFSFEAIGDWQLAVFKSDPDNEGRIMRYGLWRYTRHPNYFGEATLWWGVFLIGLSAPYGIVGLISPVLIAFLLLKVSGIPMLEKKYDGNPEFEEYRSKTNAFFPGPPETDSIGRS